MALSTGGKVALGAVVGLSAGAIGYAVYTLNKKTSQPGGPAKIVCSGTPSATNCSGVAAGNLVLASYPATMPASPSWIPCLSTAYSICPTSNYSGAVDWSVAGNAVVTSSSGASSVWPIAYSSLGDWVTTPSVSSGQIYIIVSSTASPGSGPGVNSGMIVQVGSTQSPSVVIPVPSVPCPAGYTAPIYVIGGTKGGTFAILVAQDPKDFANPSSCLAGGAGAFMSPCTALIHGCNTASYPNEPYYTFDDFGNFSGVFNYSDFAQFSSSGVGVTPYYLTVYDVTANQLADNVITINTT